MPPISGQSFVSPILVGRADQLHYLQRLLDLSVEDHASVILVSGEAGIGKSRLVAEAKAHATRHAFRVLEADCFETDMSVPYAPVSDLLRSIFLTTTASHDQQEFEYLKRELAVLLPEHATSLDANGTQMADPEQKKRHLLNCLVQLLLHLAANKPLMLVVEDIHWSDESSLEALYHLMRRGVDAPIVLVLTYRDGELNANQRRWLAQLDRERLTHEYELRPLSRHEVAAMLQAILGEERPVRVDFLQTIYGLTEGNPFFIEEVLKSLSSSGQTDPAGRKWDTKAVADLRIPRSVQDAVDQRYEQLSEQAQEVVSLAAVMGRHFDFELLQHLTGQSEDHLLAVMKELLASQIIAEESADRFVFRHALTRQALYNRLLARERKSLHGAIAASMENVYGVRLQRYVAELAYHYFEAGEWQSAFDYAVQAGENALSVYALLPALEHFNRAFEACKQLSMAVPTRLLRARAQIYEMLGDLDLARADLEAMLAQAQATQNRATEWQALVDLGALWAGIDYVQTGVYYQRAFELAREIDDARVLADSLNRLGNWHLNTERPLEAHWHHQEALSLFQQLEDQKGVAETFDLLGMASLLGANLPQSADYFSRAIAQFTALDNRQRLISSWGPMALVGPTFQTDTMVAAVTLDEAARAGESALEIARTIGHRSGEAYASITTSMSLGSKGEYGRALTLLRNALEIAEEIGHRQWTAYACIVLGAVYSNILADSSAETYLQRALALARETHSMHWQRVASGMLAISYVSQGKLEEAQALLGDALEPSVPIRTLGLRMLWRARVELALAHGDGAQALDDVERLSASALNLTSATIVPRLALLRGNALALLGRAEEALHEFQKARSGAAEYDMVPLLWRINLSLARLCGTQGRVDEARELAARAQAIVEQLALTLPPDLAQEFRERAHALIDSGAPMQQTVPAVPPGGLTSRELEIALLVSAGRTNRQIAEELVISERTAETHVRNILSKLNLTSRTQVAVWAIESGLIGPNEHPQT